MVCYNTGNTSQTSSGEKSPNLTYLAVSQSQLPVFVLMWPRIHCTGVKREGQHHIDQNIVYVKGK